MNEVVKKNFEADIIDISKECLSSLIDKKAIDPVLMDLRDVNSYLSYFMIVTGNSQIHCRSLARETVKYMAEHGFPVYGKADYSSEWIALDFGGLVVHVFTEEMRLQYNLEKLWADAALISIKYK